MKLDKSRIVTWLLLLFISCVLFNIYVLVKERNLIYNTIESRLDNVKDGTDGINGRDGHTPIKGIDYFDGKDGKDGVNGVDGVSIKGDKGDTGDTGATGANGLTPQIRCNKDKNRWEVRYSDDENWQVMNGEKVKCVGGAL